MRVYLPHCRGMLRPQVPAKLDDLGIRYELIEHDCTDEATYPRLFCEWWERGESFAIIEQDNVIHDQVFPTWETCGHLCCGFVYQIGIEKERYPFFGCTQFRAELMSRYPELAYETANNTTPGWPAWTYRINDTRFKQELRQRGLDIEAHWPEVEHLHHKPFTPL